VANFSEIQEDSDSQDESREEFCEEDKVAEVLPDVRTDHPTSTPEVQCDDGEESKNVQLVWSSYAKKEVPEGVTGPSSVEPDEDYGASDVDNTDPGRSVDFGELEKCEEFGKKSNTDYEETGSTTISHAMNTRDIGDISGTTMQDRTYETEAEEAAPTTNDVGDVISVGDKDERNSKDEEVLHGNIQTAPSENEFRNTSCMSSKGPRPTSYSGNEFEMQFRTGRRKECNELGGGDCRPTLECSWKKNSEKEAYFHLGRGVKQKVNEETRLSTGSRST